MSFNKSLRCCTRSSNLIKRPKRFLDESFEWSASFSNKKAKMETSSQDSKSKTSDNLANNNKDNVQNNENVVKNENSLSSKGRKKAAKNDQLQLESQTSEGDVNSQRDADSGVSVSLSSSPSSSSSPSTPVVVDDCSQSFKISSEPYKTRIRDKYIFEKKFKFDDVSYLSKLETSEEKIEWIMKQMDRCRKAYCSMKKRLEHLDKKKLLQENSNQMS